MLCTDVGVSARKVTRGPVSSVGGKEAALSPMAGTVVPEYRDRAGIGGTPAAVSPYIPAGAKLLPNGAERSDAVSAQPPITPAAIMATTRAMIAKTLYFFPKITLPSRIHASGQEKHVMDYFVTGGLPQCRRLDRRAESPKWKWRKTHFPFAFKEILK